MTDRLRYVLAAGLVLFYLSYADRVHQIAAIWHSQAYPQPDVEVVLKTGTRMNGMLSHEWSGAYRLTTPEGTYWLFAKNGFREMSMRTRAEPVSPWRLFVPQALFFALVTVALLGLLRLPETLKRSFRARQGGQTDS